MDVKCKPRSEVYTAKKQAEEERFPNILNRDNEKADGMNKPEVVGEKRIRNPRGDLAFDDCAKEKAWKNWVLQLG